MLVVAGVFESELLPKMSLPQRIFLEQFSNSEITCVDTWSGSDEHSNKNFLEIEKNFDKNLSFYSKRLKKFKTDSNNFFIANKQKFDLIYIDGDHSCEQVEIDINKSWEILLMEFLAQDNILI